MSYNRQKNGSQPMLGATFIPGGFDDYYMPAQAPEVVSPAPQSSRIMAHCEVIARRSYRIMADMPENMQEGVARLELEADTGRRDTIPPQTPAKDNTYSSQRQNSFSQAPQNNPYENPPPQHLSNASRYSSYGSSTADTPAQSRTYQQIAQAPDFPHFSPFPKLAHRGPNVPESDDEREAVLENARTPVLNSNDPEMQLAWAQDALTYVDAAMLYEQRISETQPPRPGTPQVEHQLRVDAMNIVQFLADQHHPKAEFMRGMWLEFGKFGLRIDKREAFRCYSRAADKGYARAEYRIGMQYEQSNDPVKALQHYKRGSDAGDSASNYRLGMMTLMGQHGQPQDFGRGIQLIRQAAVNADENAPQGAYVLGMLQARELPQINVPEIFLPFDERAARQNIEKAAFLGFAKAQLKMGAAYELCELGCEFSPALSLHYNALAARQGEAEAEMAISKWFLCGYEGVFQKNEELAFVYAQRAAHAGLATAEFAMGYFYEIGMFVAVDADKALEWYERAARNGNKDAGSRIEGISKQRLLSKKDHESVAINRIRSQYGSKRGGRPDRFKQGAAGGAPALPTITDTPAPEPPAAQTPKPTSPTGPGGIRAPSRNATTTPYPLEDQGPSLTKLPSAGPDRGSSTTPYPLDDRPPPVAGRRPTGGTPGPGPTAGFLNPDLVRPASAAPPATARPTSAFGISPHLLAQQQQQRQGGPIDRPYTSVGDIHGGGRGGPGPPPLRVDVKMDEQQQQQQHARRGGRLQKQQSHPHSAAPMSAGAAPPNREPKLPDIGFAAPLDNKPPPLDPHAYPEGGGPAAAAAAAAAAASGSGKPLPTPATGRDALPSQQKQAAQQGRPQSARPHSPAQRPGSRASSAGRPGSAGGGRPAAAGAGGSPGLKAEGGVAVPGRKPVDGGAALAGAGAGAGGKTQGGGGGKVQPGGAGGAGMPPGKGPQTFDAMGIPQAKRDSECVSAFFSISRA
ncbi:hypothetical protein BDY21DRAFT_384618 [Lineolata rhizophorae]|uniref:HCP-like protein n=1 Tax=Lineolata rhizophorae TaxID=578093 RepID=A0A6A6P5V0_9PEZI|nr:hypothetical protein BDY21DRAFT_384618 [Lineolata rhizophorae]